MLTNPHLDNLIQKETVAEMLATLTPKQLAVVALRWDGLPQGEAGKALGLGRNCAFERLDFARRRIRQQFPHVDTLLQRKP